MSSSFLSTCVRRIVNVRGVFAPLNGYVKWISRRSVISMLEGLVTGSAGMIASLVRCSCWLHCAQMLVRAGLISGILKECVSENIMLCISNYVKSFILSHRLYNIDALRELNRWFYQKNTPQKRIVENTRKYKLNYT